MGLQVESTTAGLEEAAGCSTPDLLNFIVASGYVAEDADFTFHENRADSYPLNKYVFQHPPAGGGRIKKRATWRAFRH